MPPKHIDQAYPRLVVMRTLAAALQSNWARLVAGSTSHFGLFRDALTVLEQDAPELDNALISDAISTLVNMADNLPLSGPSDWQAQHTASVLAELGKTLDRFPTADATTLQQLTEALAQLKAGILIHHVLLLRPHWLRQLHQPSLTFQPRWPRHQNYPC